MFALPKVNQCLGIILVILIPKRIIYIQSKIAIVFFLLSITLHTFLLQLYESMNSLQAKLASQQKLLSFLSKQLQEQQTLEKYYQNCLNQITGQGAVLQPQFKLSPSPTKKPQRRMKTQESPSLMEESMVSIELNKIKVEKQPLKKDQFSSEMEYQQISKEISKMIDNLAGKDASFKKTVPSTPQRNKSFSNKSGVKPTQTLKITNNNLSLLSISKTDRFQKQPQTDKQKLLTQLGDTSPIVSNDEIVVNLLSHLRVEEQKFTDSLLSLTSASSTQKIRNYIVHLCEKNQQTLFKLRQKEKDVVESKLEMNRQMIRNGYTDQMKRLIENAFTSSKQFH